MTRSLRRFHFSCLKSLNQVFKEYEARTGKKVSVTYVSIEELEGVVASNPADLQAVLHYHWATGNGLVGDVTDNAKYPNWNPTPVIDFLA